MKGIPVHVLGRTVLTAAAITAAVATLLASQTTAQTAAQTAAETTTGTAAQTAVAATTARAVSVQTTAHRERISSGGVFWANAGAEHQARPLSPAKRARLLLGVMRRQHATLGLLAESTGGQARAIRRASRGTFGAVPGRRRGETNAVVYDTRSYRLERVVRLRSFSYHGRRMPLVVAVLRDRSTGARIGAMAVHHPSSETHRGAQDRWQRSAWRRETRALRRLRAAYHGRISTYLGGDFNDSSTCRMVARTGMVSPVATVSSCPTARTRIDQVFADRTVTFSDYRAMTRGIGRMTDHAGIYAATFTLRQPA
jgi:hypothetical protein